MMELWLLFVLVGALLAGLSAVWLAIARRTSGRRRETRAGVLPSTVRSRRVLLASLVGGAALTSIGGLSALTRRQAAYNQMAADTPTPQPTSVASSRPDPEPTRESTATPASMPSPTVGSGAVATVRPARPNVLLVTIDTVRPDRIGAYGFVPAHTPAHDRLAAEGTRFSRAICQLPQTNASIASVFTGLYPTTSGVRVHMVDKLRPGSQTLAGILAASGYHTAGIYSWVSLDHQFCGLDQGFQTYEGYVLNRTGVFANPQLEALAAIYRQLKEKVEVVRTIDVVLGQSEEYEKVMDGRADITTAAALAWLDAQTGADPFFFWVHYFDPHYPYAPPAPYDRLFGLQYDGTIDGSVDTIHQIQQGQRQVSDADRERLLELYQGEIAFTDVHLGQLLQRLRDRGLEDETIVVVTADHGESFGERGRWTHGGELVLSDLAVPLLIRFPPLVPAGKVIAPPAQLVDILPTILDLASVRLPQPVQGTSLVPLLSGRDDGQDRGAISELAYGSSLSLIDSNWMLIKDKDKSQLELFDLTELENPAVKPRDLSAAEPAVAAELDARLARLMRQP